MNYDKLHINLIRSKGDEPLESKKYQAEIIEFSKLLPQNSLVTTTMYAMDSICGGGGLAGQFILVLAPSIIPSILAAAQLWLNLRAGKKLRLKVGDIEAEASNLKELDAILARAIMMQELQAKSKSD